jgi:3-isopropylmalate/(R)-2-methylmalate dehydratase small subunit
LLTCKEAERIREGETVQLDLPGRAIILSDGQRLACDSIPDFLLEMVEAGGLLPQLKRRMSSRGIEHE